MVEPRKLEIKKHVMEKGGKKLKVLVAHSNFSYKNVPSIRLVLELEHSKTPILFILPEYFHGDVLDEALITVKNNELAITPGYGIGLKENRIALESVRQLQVLAKKYNAHLLYAGQEYDGNSNSAFLLGSNGPSIVRRKVVYGLSSPVSTIDAININGFHVLPLICSEAMDRNELLHSLKLLFNSFEAHTNTAQTSNGSFKHDAMNDVFNSHPFFRDGVDLVAIPSQSSIWDGTEFKNVVKTLVDLKIAHDKTIFANTGLTTFKHCMLNSKAKPVGEEV